MLTLVNASSRVVLLDCDDECQTSPLIPSVTESHTAPAAVETFMKLGLMKPDPNIILHSSMQFIYSEQTTDWKLNSIRSFFVTRSGRPHVLSLAIIYMSSLPHLHQVLVMQSVLDLDQQPLKR